MFSHQPVYVVLLCLIIYDQQVAFKLFRSAFTRCHTLFGQPVGEWGGYFPLGEWVVDLRTHSKKSFTQPRLQVLGVTLDMSKAFNLGPSH